MADKQGPLVIDEWCNALALITPYEIFPYFNQPRFRKYQNGVIALATINTIANG